MPEAVREREAAPHVSIVVPLYDEQATVAALVAAVRAAMGGGPAWELILVDDGSGDGTYEAALGCARADRRVRVLRLARNYGQTPAMQAGFDAARGDVIVSMDGDLQNDPADIPVLVGTLEQGYDLVAGYRMRRQDKLLTRRMPSWIANRLIRWITGVPIRDNGCSLKAYRRDVMRQVHLYSDMHRFIPAIAAATAGARITEVPVQHHARRHGRSKYGLSRVAKVLADLVTIHMIRSFRERPLALFGMVAIAASGLGVLFAAAALYAWLAFDGAKADAVVLPGAALLWFGLAAYLVMMGLTAETILREHSRARVPMPVAREIERIR